MDDNSHEVEQQNIKPKTKLLNILLVFGFIVIISYYSLSAPLGNKDAIIHIHSGESVTTVSSELENKNAIRHSLILKIFVRLFESSNGVVSGDYLIKKHSPVFVVAWQIGRGHHNIDPIKITIREGLNNEQIAVILADKLSGFRKDLFLSGVNDKQGYLFPDTYFLFPLDTPDEIIDKLSNNFQSKIKKLNGDIGKSGKSLQEIITMASILEGEAGGKEDIETISGILWKRISLGMPLQVDIDKSTYTNKGLPNRPLNNPGSMSITASLNPKDSPYLYYLHDKNGNVHFAVTFEEHKRNISNYLK